MVEEKIYSEMERLADHDGKHLVCVSGGIDSTVLLHILHKGGWNVEVAHCNFSLRGKESDGDEIFVRNLCHDLGIVCHVEKYDTHGYAIENGLNTQIAARELRYDFFYRLKYEFGFDSIVVAHHLDDSIETFFINLIRGTGIKGLCGIGDSRNGIIRPMLHVTREEIAQYAKENGILYREDRTNGEDHYLRNRIRHHIIPQLTEYSQPFRTTMAGNMERIAQSEQFTERVLSKEIDKMRISENEYSIASLKDNPDRSFILFSLLSPMGFNPDVISQLENVFISGLSGRRFMSENHTAFLSKDTIKIRQKKVYEERCTFDSESFKTMTVEEAGDYRHAHSNIAYLDRDKMSFPLEYRKWEPGDRFHPLGMKGSKTLGDFLADRAISLADRDDIHVMVDNNGIIAWVVGIEISDLCKIDKKTSTVIKLQQP